LQLVNNQPVVNGLHPASFIVDLGRAEPGGGLTHT
jgi:hypothetical protein